jgi:hypothetical protein
LVWKPTSSGTPAIERRPHRRPTPWVDTAGRRRAGSPDGSPLISSPPPGSCLACPADRNTAGRHRPSGCPSSESRCRRSARQGLGSLQPSTTGSASPAIRTPSRAWVAIEGDSYRLKEAHDRTEQRARQRRGAKS